MSTENGNSADAEENASQPSLQQIQVADVANYFIRNAKSGGPHTITLPNGAWVSLSRSERGSADALVVSFLPAVGETYGPRIVLNLTDPRGKSQLLLPPPEGAPKEQKYSVGNPSPAALATQVDKVLYAIVLELKRQETEQVDAIQEEVSNDDAILNALNL